MSGNSRNIHPLGADSLGARVGFGYHSELSPTQVEFIEWLCDPHKSGTQGQWAEDHNVAAETAARWKRQAKFREVWEKRAEEIYGGVTRVNEVVNALFRKAIDGDVAAMKLYLQYTNKFTPTTKSERVTTTKLEEMSNDELAALADNVTAIRKTS